MSSVEALSMGLVCLTELVDEYHDFIPDHPFIAVTKENLKNTLLELTQNKDFLINKKILKRIGKGISLNVDLLNHEEIHKIVEKFRSKLKSKVKRQIAKSKGKKAKQNAKRQKINYLFLERQLRYTKSYQTKTRNNKYN